MDSLHILQLAAPYTSASSPSSDPASPTALLDDLKHYQDLFSKLRFSYTEQVTKEKFLRAITSNPPEFVAQGANAALEEKLGRDKAELKGRKEEVRGLIAALEEQGRELVRRYEHLQLQQTQLDTLPASIDGLRDRIEALRAQQPPTPSSSDPDLNLPLAATHNLLQQRETELAALQTQISLLQEQRLPQLRQQAAGLQEDLVPLEARKNEAVAAARDAQARRAEGSKGLGDELEERGRWLRAVDTGLRRMLEV